MSEPEDDLDEEALAAEAVAKAMTSVGRPTLAHEVPRGDAPTEKSLVAAQLPSRERPITAQSEAAQRQLYEQSLARKNTRSAAAIMMRERRGRLAGFVAGKYAVCVFCAERGAVVRASSKSWTSEDALRAGGGVECGVCGRNLSRRHGPTPKTVDAEAVAPTLELHPPAPEGFNAETIFRLAVRTAQRAAAAEDALQWAPDLEDALKAVLSACSADLRFASEREIDVAGVAENLRAVTAWADASWG